MTDNNIMRTVIFQILLITMVATVPIVGPALAQETAQPEEQQGPQIETVDHEFQFTGIQVDVKNKNLSQFTVVVQNPAGEVQPLLVQGLNGPSSRQIIQLRPEETRQLNITPSSPPGYPIYKASSMQEFVPGTEIEGEVDVSDAYLTIEYQLIDINSEPSVPHNIVIVFLGGLVVILSTWSGFQVNSRNTRLAVPKNRKLTTGVRDSPTYNWSEDDPGALKLAIFIKDWIKAFGLFIVIATTFVWGFLRLLGAELHGTYNVDLYFFQFDIVIPELMENSMVYMMYGEFIFFWPCLFVGIWLARTKWIEISDVDPRTGDNYLYWLTPERFRDLTVLTKVRRFDENGNIPTQKGGNQPGIIEYQAPKSWLYEINEDTQRDSYEVVNYDIHENIAEVSWSGELKQLNPSLIRSRQRVINYVLETATWAIDRYERLKDFFVPFVQKEAQYRKARETAILEGAEMPDDETGTRERVEKRLENQNEAEILEDNQLETAEKLQEQKPDDFELIDEESGSSSSDMTTREGGDLDE